MNPMTNKLLTPEEVSKILNISKRSLYNLCRSRVRETQEHPIPCIKIHSQLRFRSVDIESWLQQLSEAAK